MIWGVQKCKYCGIRTQEVCQVKTFNHDEQGKRIGIKEIYYICSECYRKDQCECKICHSEKCNHM